MTVPGDHDPTLPVPEAFIDEAEADRDFVDEMTRLDGQRWSFSKLAPRYSSSNPDAVTNIRVDVQRFFTFVLLAMAVSFVIVNLRPGFWGTNSTPTGGDLGAHVWSPAYLRDVLLPDFRLTGWTQDWYAGFPAFTFYMVLPSLAIVIVNIGFSNVVVMALAVGLVAMGAVWATSKVNNTTSVVVVALVGFMAIVACVPVSYGVAMKLVVISGVATLPVAMYLLGRLGGLAFPGPPLMAVAAIAFIFDRSYNIYGGNLMSTMAGEFAYSIGLTFAVLFLAVAARGLDTGRHRALAAVLLAITGLNHLFPAFFAVTGLFALWIVRPGWQKTKWVVTTGMISAALAAWWVLPFFWNRGYLNDMGWGKERRYMSALWSRSQLDVDFLRNDPPLQIFVVLAVIGFVISVARRQRLGAALGVLAVIIAVAFVSLPETRFWNVRILPFYYITIYMLGLIGVSEIIRLVDYAIRQTGRRVTAAAAGGVLAIAATLPLIVWMGFPLRSLPRGSINSAGAYEWLGVSTGQFNLGPSWTQYNFEGYENRGPTEEGGGTFEYRNMVATMTKVGEDFGCGRALWEYEEARIRSYGTTMAPMLLPHWSDRCIGSMEGLYFEASATVPFHFLAQSELSANPSRAQRDLNYSSLDVARGVDHLQMLGVRYYMAFTPDAVAQARNEPRLEEIAFADPWAIFLVADSVPVIALDHLPAVVTDITDAQGDWFGHQPEDDGDLDTPNPYASGPGAQYWEDYSPETILKASSGPSDWPRITKDEEPERIDVDPVLVDNVEIDNQSIKFTVDQIGTPVLVRTSYFPNWKVDGADGPYRVTPNFMVVVPTSTDVKLTYGRSTIELLAWLITIVGIAAAWFVANRLDTNKTTDPFDELDESDDDDGFYEKHVYYGPDEFDVPRPRVIDPLLE